jgi:hypothetical protein
MHRVSMRHDSLVLSLVGLLVGLVAPATGFARGDLMATCRADAARLCPGISPGGGRLAQCLREHAKQISAPCKQVIAERRARGGRGPGGSGLDWSACRQDVGRLCPEAVGNREKVGHACTRRRPSSGCKDTMAAFRQQRRDRQPAR